MIKTSPIRLLAVVTCLSLFCGCQSLSENSRQLLAKYSPNPNDYRNPGDDVDDQWDSVGVEGRAVNKMDTEPGDWVDQYLTSNRAKSINRNLGVYSK